MVSFGVAVKVEGYGQMQDWVDYMQDTNTVPMATTFAALVLS